LSRASVRNAIFHIVEFIGTRPRDRSLCATSSA